MSSAGQDPDDPPVGAPETVVEGEAVELPSEPPSAYSWAAHSSQAEPAGYAGGAQAYSSAGPATSGRGWPDAGIDLAEHPEILVGAAFGGGLLLALIVRSLGR